MTTPRDEHLSALGEMLPVTVYDRSALSVGDVHLGVGGFRRAHQTMYLDRLMSDGQALDWAVCGVGVLPSDRWVRDVLRAQDGLYTLVEKATDGTWWASVIGAIVQVLLAPTPSTRIVSMTITEGGYLLDAVTGQFDAQDVGVQRDLVSGTVPATAPVLVVEALARRRSRGVPPFTVLSSFIFFGAAYLVSDSAMLRPNDLGIRNLFAAQIFGITAATWLALVAVAVAWLLLDRTRFERHVSAVGGKRGDGTARGRSRGARSGPDVHACGLSCRTGRDHERCQDAHGAGRRRLTLVFAVTAAIVVERPSPAGQAQCGVPLSACSSSRCWSMGSTSVASIPSSSGSSEEPSSSRPWASMPGHGPDGSSRSAGRRAV